VLKLHVASVYFNCFRGMLASVLYRCCKSGSGCCTCCIGVFECMSQMFHLFHTYVASVSLGWCKSRFECCIYMHVTSVCFKYFRCFIRMLQVFYLNIAYGLQWLQTCFPGVLDVCCKCFNYFRHMLQVFHLDVAIVDLGVPHVAVEAIYSSHLLQLLGLPACAWVWRGTMVRVRDTKRHGPWYERWTRSGVGPHVK